MAATPLPIADFLNTGLWLGLKLIYVIAFALYFVFTLIAIRQVKLMSATILGPSSKWLRVASIIYAIFSGLCLLLALLIL